MHILKINKIKHFIELISSFFLKKNNNNLMNKNYKIFKNHYILISIEIICFRVFNLLKQVKSLILFPLILNKKFIKK